MPYKFEYKKQKIPQELDRRTKLTPEQKEEIKKLYGTISQRKLAKKYGVSRSTIVFIGKPEAHKRNLYMRKIRGGSKIYYDTETATKQKRDHRQYKQKLAKKGLLIKEQDTK